MKSFYSGFVDVAVAIATGSAVAQGQSPVKLKLANRLERKRLAVVLEEDVPVDEPRTRSSPSSPARKSVTCGDMPAMQQQQGLMMKEVQQNQINPMPALQQHQQGLMIKDVQGVVGMQQIKDNPMPAMQQDLMVKEVQGVVGLQQNQNNPMSIPFCSASQSLSVSRGNTNTAAMSAMMTSYGSMMGQMAKGMLEGVGPQLMSMLQNFQVEYYVGEYNLANVYLLRSPLLLEVSL